MICSLNIFAICSSSGEWTFFLCNFNIVSLGMQKLHWSHLWRIGSWTFVLWIWRLSCKLVLNLHFLQLKIDFLFCLFSTSTVFNSHIISLKPCCNFNSSFSDKRLFKGMVSRRSWTLGRLFDSQVFCSLIVTWEICGFSKFFHHELFDHLMLGM